MAWLITLKRTSYLTLNIEHLFLKIHFITDKQIMKQLIQNRYKVAG